MSQAIKEILDRAFDSVTKPEAERPEWKNPTNDAIVLSFVIRRLVIDLHNCNKQLALELRNDLCKVCGSYTWGRPPGLDGTMDFSRRTCSECGEIRPEPEEQN